MLDMTKVIWRITKRGDIEYLDGEGEIRLFKLSRVSGLNNSQIAFVDNNGRWYRFALKTANETLKESAPAEDVPHWFVGAQNAKTGQLKGKPRPCFGIYPRIKFQSLFRLYPLITSHFDF
jgi:hypothetical protein